MSTSEQTPPQQTVPPMARRPRPDPSKPFEFKDWAMI